MTIGFLGGGTGTFFAAIMKEFRRRFQEVRVSLVEMTPGMLHRALQSGAIDIAFTRPVQPSDVPIYVPNIFVEPLNAVMLNSHPLAKKRSIFIRELANERFILYERNHSPFSFDKVIILCAEAGFSPRIGATATNAAGVVVPVEAGRA